MKHAPSSAADLELVADGLEDEPRVAAPGLVVAVLVAACSDGVLGHRLERALVEGERERRPRRPRPRARTRARRIPRPRCGRRRCRRSTSPCGRQFGGRQTDGPRVLAARRDAQHDTIRCHVSSGSSWSVAGIAMRGVEPRPACDRTPLSFPPCRDEPPRPLRVFGRLRDRDVHRLLRGASRRPPPMSDTCCTSSRMSSRRMSSRLAAWTVTSASSSSVGSRPSTSSISVVPSAACRRGRRRRRRRPRRGR